ncbi:MAG: hypothetical protein EA419_05190 [Wenzhouxiangella sp.]|nr:MAG: hypothetical protein EA419_05190 [Wenzhouxiangella sp.]
MTSLAAAHVSNPISPAPERRSPRTVILVNPDSFRMSGANRLARITRFVDGRGITLYRAHGPDEIATALGRAELDARDRLIVIGGDGTLQATVTCLADQAENGSAPILCMLGGGRTNFTARDLGSHARLFRSLEQLIDSPDSWTVEQRRVLQLGSATHGTLYGFFVAGALVDEIIRDCHEYRRKKKGWLRSGHPATLWRVAQLALLGLSGRRSFHQPKLRIEADGLGALDGHVRLVLLSSLEHAGGIDPYADRGTGALRLTVIGADARRFWRRLPALVRGRFHPDQNPASGYLSGRTRRLRLQGLPSICLDGQEFSLDPDETLTVQAGPAFRFLRP